MNSWKIFALIVNLIVSLLIAGKFGEIAQRKGYNPGKYVCMCFFLGTLGWCWVAALPDQVLLEKLDRLQEEKDTVEEEQIHAEIISEQGDWQCTCGRINAAYVSTCTCGTNKREALAGKSS